MYCLPADIMLLTTNGKKDLPPFAPSASLGQALIPSKGRRATSSVDESPDPTRYFTMLGFIATPL